LLLMFLLLLFLLLLLLVVVEHLTEYVHSRSRRSTKCNVLK
jgi:hypothetical protein